MVCYFQHVRVQQCCQQTRSHSHSQSQPSLISQPLLQQQRMFLFHQIYHSMSCTRHYRPLSAVLWPALLTSCLPFHCCWIPIYCRAQKYPSSLHNQLRYILVIKIVFITDAYQNHPVFSAICSNKKELKSFSWSVIRPQLTFCKDCCHSI